MARARQADAALARGESWGPLHGVPMTVKESFNVAGLPTTYGFEAFRDNRATTDAVVVQRLKAAGAVIFGKTNVPVSLADWQSFNPVYGTTNNPWDLTRTPGGSSGGSAAALAAGLTALEIGSDIGASIRNPAHYCGVWGHKPTWGVVPLKGHELRPMEDADHFDIAAAGPLARSAVDLGLAMDVLAAPLDLWTPIGRMPVAWRTRDLPPTRCRVAVLYDDPQAEVDASVQQALRALAGFLREQGVHVTDNAAPVDSAEAHAVYIHLLRAATGSHYDDAGYAQRAGDGQAVHGGRRGLCGPALPRHRDDAPRLDAVGRPAPRPAAPLGGILRATRSADLPGGHQPGLRPPADRRALGPDDPDQRPRPAQHRSALLGRLPGHRRPAGDIGAAGPERRRAADRRADRRADARRPRRPALRTLAGARVPGLRGPANEMGHRMSSIKVHPDALDGAVQALFRQAGSEVREAELVAAQLVGANLTGHDSHGVGMIPRYIEVLLAGELHLNVHPTTVLEAGAITVLDGGMGLGQVAGFEAMEVAIATARRHGLSLTGLRNSHHIGRIGHWAEQGAAAGLITLHFVNVISTPMVAPFGGRDARLVTNPIAIAVPRTGQRPLVLDFATSKLAVGKVRVAYNKGVALPPDALLDVRGDPTTDPAALFASPGGALLPFGDHKGSGLALMCEILGAALIGGPVMSAPPSSRRIVNNMLTIAIEPGFFAERGAMDDAITALVDWVRASPPADPAAGVLLAGEPEIQARRERAEGIEVDAETWRQLEHAAEQVGLGAPAFRRAAGLDP